MKIKKGDKVQIIAGKERGKTGTVMKVLPEAGRIVVEGINMLTKHQKPRREGEKGTKIKFAAPLNVSNAILVCPKCGKMTRIGYSQEDGGKKKMRACKKCKGSL